MEIGFMQGRLSELVDGKIQAFPWRDWEQEFALARRHGFPLMEWTLDQDRLYENPLMTEAGRERIRALSEANGVRVLSLTGDCFMQAPFFKQAGDERARLLDDLRAVLEACAESGIRYVLVPLVDNGRIENAEQERNLLDGLAPLTGFLRANAMQIVFESDFPPQRLTDFIATLPEDAYGINYDVGNSAALGYDSEEEIAAYGKRIVNVHIKDRALHGTTVPLGEGNADFPRVFRALKAARYAGNFILQTARARDGDHTGVLCRYRDLVQGWIGQYGLGS